MGRGTGSRHPTPLPAPSAGPREARGAPEILFPRRPGNPPTQAQHLPTLESASGKWLLGRRRPRGPQGPRVNQSRGLRVRTCLWLCGPAAVGQLHLPRTISSAVAAPWQRFKAECAVCGSVNSRSRRSLSRNGPRTHTGPTERPRGKWLQQPPGARWLA